MKNALSKTLSDCLVNVLYRLETADERQVNDDFSLSLMEDVAAKLQGLDAQNLAEFIAVVHKAAEEELNSDRKSYLRNFPANFGLQEALEVERSKNC